MFYNFIRILIMPIVWFVILFSKKKSKFLKNRLYENFSVLDNKPYIWVHASSVGEINLSETMIKKILLNRKENILITMFTDTGLEVAKNKFSKNERVIIKYFPLDSRSKIKEILKRIDLRFLILVETEIWPNLISLTHKKAKILMVNGRISDKSYRRYERFKFILKNVLVKIDKFFMQSKEDSRRIIELGADKNKVETLGNLKFDIEFEKYTHEELQEFKNDLGIKNQKVLTCGSIRTGEYEVILDAYKKMKDTKLILVPRHIERTPMICEILKTQNLKFARYSQKNVQNLEKFDIIIVDKLGILRKIYAISDFAFVGGTLVNVGGHSLLEPLFYGKTPIFGPYLQNVSEISKDILKYGIGYKIKTSQDFLKAIDSIKEKQEKSKEKIDKLFSENQNLIEVIIKYLDDFDKK